MGTGNSSKDFKRYVAARIAEPDFPYAVRPGPKRIFDGLLARGGSRRAALQLFVLTALATLSLTSPPAADTLQNLFAPPLARPVPGLGDSVRPDQLQALLDGDHGTSARFKLEDASPLDLVFAYSGEGIASEELVIVHTDGAPRAAGFDLLFSTVSPTHGFRSVRNGELDPLAPSQTIKFPSSGANWVMLRLYPAREAVELSLADIELRGQPGPPQSRYKFGESPVRALEVIEALTTLGDSGFTLSEDERKVFERTSDGNISQRDFEEIALIASGVRDAAARAGYIARLDAYEDRLRAELDVNAPALELGAGLLTWLHENVLSGGYREKQTDLSTVIDDALFNCVSSAVIYNALGQRLGLDLRAIEVPDHAFSILYDGADHVDVETTTARGFNPRRKRIAEFELLTGFEYIPQSNKTKRREIGRAGLAALIYYNHGVGFLRQGDYRQALMANFRAMSLDPEFSSAATNSLAALGRWSRDLSKGGRWQEAAKVAALGRQLAPDDRGLASIQVRIWQDWALATAEAGDIAGAIDLLTGGAREIPDVDFDPLLATLFIRPGEEDIGKGAWEAALERVDLGLTMLKGKARADLDEWRERLFLRHADRAMRDGEYAAAALVLSDGLAAYPASKRVARSIRYLAQTWAEAAADFDAGLAVLSDMVERFRTPGNLGKIAEAYTARKIRAAASAGMPIEQALEMATRAEPVLEAAGADMELSAEVYRTYGANLIEKRDWQAAADLYSAALGRFPDDYYIRQNARYVVQEWQRAALAEGGSRRLKEVVERMRVLFPAFAAGKGFGEAELKRHVLKLVKEADYTGALDYLNEAQLLLSADTYRDLRLYVVDNEAGRAIKAKDWGRAAAIYSEGRRQIGEERIFSNNVAYVAQEWTKSAGATDGAEGVARAMKELVALFPGDQAVAKMGAKTLKRLVSGMVKSGRLDDAKAQVVLARTFLAPKDVRSLTIVLYRDQGDALLSRRDWPAALTAYRTGLDIIPDSSDLKRNIPYAFQEWAKEALDDGGAVSLVAAVVEMKEVFPSSKSREGVLESVISRHVIRLVDNGMPDAALVFLEETAPAIEDKTLHNAKVSVYERWARQHFNDEGWGRAAEIYERGLEDVGKSSLLSNNRSYVRSRIK
ncbi:hypothetical protein [Roseibium sp.]|uniref:hypothetical protein n=1 Tax=Roseibium sp. TaxID=1936156 RepID=UPI003D14F33C